MIGRVIKGKYRIYDEVGSGAFATVYLGRNMDTNEIVAVKVLSQQLTKDSRYVERFRREALLAQRLQHSNIVRILDHGIEDNIHFLVMEFVEGLTLDKVIRRKGRLSVAETLSYTEQACAALEAAYQVGIVHRDIKPANLMITPDGKVKVMDFGIARMESMAGLTQTGTFMGTPRYISPEIAQGAQADVRSDLYALGLVTYEMLVGAPPFDAENPWAVLRLQIERDLPPIHQVRSDVPPWLEAITLKAAAKDPGQRFQTPAEMLAALREQTPAPSDVPTLAPLPFAVDSAVGRPDGRQGASKGLVWGLAIAAVLVAAGLLAVVLFVLAGDQPTAAPTAVAIAPTQGDNPTPAPTNTPQVIVVTATSAIQMATEPAPDTPVPTEPIPTEAPRQPTASAVQPTDTAPPLTSTPSQMPTSTPTSEPSATPQPTALPTQAPTDPPEPSSTPTSPPAPPISGWIAYSSGGTLHIVDAANGQDRFAPLPGMRQPDFRADGQLVIANGEGAGRDSLWTINAQSGAFDREQGPFTNDFHPSWSPGGDRFAYSSLHHGLGNYEMLYTQALAGPGQQPEVTLSYNGQQIRGSSPVWMHDDWIAFTGCDYWPGGTGGSRCGIYRMPSWGEQPLPVHSGSTNMRATDNYGGQLLYMSPESGDWEVYLAPNQGGNARNLSQRPGSHDALGTFSPDGRLIAFVSNAGGSWAIWIVKPDGTGRTRLFDLPGPLTSPWEQESISWGP